MDRSKFHMNDYQVTKLQTTADNAKAISMRYVSDSAVEPMPI